MQLTLNLIAPEQPAPASANTFTKALKAARRWWKQRAERAKAFADALKAACMPLWQEICIADKIVIGFNYEDDLARADQRRRKPRIVHRECWNCNANTTQRLTYLGNCRCLACGCRSTCGADNDPDDTEQA